MKSYDEIKLMLSEIEPTEMMYSKLTEEDIPVLKQILNEEEPWLASRSVFALSRFQTPNTYTILEDLTTDPRIEIRVSLAFCAKKSPPDLSKKIVRKLIEDNEVGVRKFAYQSIPPNVDNEFISRLNAILLSERDPYLKQILTNKLKELKYDNLY